MKKKLRLNPETLHYEKPAETKGFKLKDFVWIILSGIGFGFVSILLVAYLYPSPHERQLRRDLVMLEKNYDDLNLKLTESIEMYEKLLEKEKEIQKLTFDAEIEQLESISKEMSVYSPDFDFSKLLKITSVKISSSGDQAFKIAEKIRILLDIAYSRKMFLQSIPAIIPVEKTEFVLISGTGMRIHPIFKTLKPHNGVDLAARQGTVVVATGNGTVIRPPADTEGLGNIVAIDHGFGYISIYACLLKSEVKPGNRVIRGQTIGLVGRSGIATGPHLHYEVRKNGKPVNPVNYFFLSITPEELFMYMEKAKIQNQNMS